MDAIVTAGGIPLPDDPLYIYTKGDSKAMLDVAGKPMIQWVLDALNEAQHVGQVIIIGLSPKSDITCKKPLHFISNQGRMLANIVAGVNKSIELNSKAEYVLLITSDIPGIKAKMIDWMIETSTKTKEDMYYGIVPREVMEARYPGSNRTFTKLKGMQFCGADLQVSHVTMATDPDHLKVWEKLLGKRKSPLKQAATIGFGTLFRVVTRQITLDELVATITKRIGITGRPIIWESAEPGMDVDKPHQLELIRADLEKQIKKAKRKKAKSK